MSPENFIGSVDKDVVIQQEQQYFDRAFDCMMEADVRWAKAPLTGGTAAERRALKRAAAKRKVPASDEPVAFGRMMDEDGESFYIGKAPIFDGDKNLLVINWQAPAAARYNQATPTDPQGLVWRRSFTAPHNHIEDLSDLLFQEIAEQLQDLEEVVAYSAQEDDLLEALRRKRTGAMTDIVATIQAAQDQLIRADKDQLLVIQGGPGTGKTAVALHRVSWLLYTFDQEMRPQDVLVVGPNQTFTRYIQKVLPGLGDEDVHQFALDRLLANGVTRRGMDPDPVATIKGSAHMAAVVKRALWQRVAIPAEGVVVDMGSSRKVIVSRDVLRTLVENLDKLPYSEGRQQFSERLASYCREYQVSGSSRGLTDAVVPASLEQAVERVWKKLSPQQFLRELYGSKQRLMKANKVDLLSDLQVQLLHRPPVRAMSEEPWTRDDLALIDYASFLMNGADQQYRHIVVDEAQDLSYMELLALKHRSSSGSMTVVGDLAQSTGPHAHDSWGEVAEALDQGQSQDVSELEYGYRVPKQVFDLARPVLAAAAPEVQAPDVLRDVSFDPAWSFPASAELAGAVAQKVIERSLGYFMGVIAHPDHWEALRGAFSAAGISWAESTSGELSNAINLVTPEDAKGLEFDSVIVVDPQRIIDMPHGLRLLYIALTRTTTRLDLVVPRDRLPEILTGHAPEIPPLPVEEDLPRPDPVPALSNETTATGPEAPAASVLDHHDPVSVPVSVPVTGDHSPRFEALQAWAKPVVQSYIDQQIHHLEGGDFSPKMVEAIVEELHRHYLGQ